MTRTLARFLLPRSPARFTAAAEIRRDPNGVNVNANGATIGVHHLRRPRDQVPAEAFWCGELIPAAPDRGFKCDPATHLRPAAATLRPVAACRAHGRVHRHHVDPALGGAARLPGGASAGASSAFFYVRRFVSLRGGPDEYVFVTCRMAGGGARVPLALLDVQLASSNGESVLSLEPGEAPPVCGRDRLQRHRPAEGPLGGRAARRGAARARATS